MAHLRRCGDDMTERGGPPEELGAAITRFLRDKGYEGRVAQAAVLEDWIRVAGPQIARMTEARSISADGTLLVAVATNAWMSELAMHEPEFLARLNEGFDPPRVRRIRWQLRSAGPPA
jgi:predicted nucleic acid-binding Zn ribbon protein